MSDEEVIEFVLSFNPDSTEEGVKEALKTFRMEKENKDFQVGCY